MRVFGYIYVFVSNATQFSTSQILYMQAYSYYFPEYVLYVYEP